MPNIYCAIAIDTEPDCDVKWKRSNPLAFKSVIYGIPKILRPIWDKYQVKPVYFVSPEVVENKACCQVLKEEVNKGAEIGTHLHPEYINPQKKYKNYEGTDSNEFACYAYSQEIECQKIKNLTELIKHNCGVQPISYRAGRYGADLDTIKCLKKLNYKVDSSVTPGISWKSKNGPDHSKSPLQPYFISDNDYYKSTDKKEEILEIPITIYGKRLGFAGKLLPNHWFFYNWLRPTHMTAIEQKWLIKKILKEYKNKSYVMLNIMFHSMEIIPGASPFVRCKYDQQYFLARLSNILATLQKLGVKFVTLKEAHKRIIKEN